MQPSKSLAVMFLLGAVLVGGALGFTADRYMIRDQIRSPRPRLHLADRLQLDARQRAKLDTILDRRRQRYDIIMATVRDQIDSLRHHAREEIRQMLTEEQRREFERALAEMNSDRSRKD
ncbi:MAG TPA: hypothetical protein VF178_02095 [Gemmatimonadaceae bacterium]